MVRRSGRSAALLLLIGCACSSSKAIRAVILDAQGQPVPGAILYCEAYVPGSDPDTAAFDFGFAAAGSDGQAPAPGSAPLQLRWRSSAHLALAAFAPGKQPQVILDRSGALAGGDPAGNVVFKLRDLPRAYRFNPALATLGYPFPSGSALAARAAAPEAASLRAAFREAWAELPPEGRSATEQRKLEAIERLPR